MTSSSISRLQFTTFLKAQTQLSVAGPGVPENRSATAPFPTTVGAVRKPVRIEYIIKDLPLY